MTLDNKLGIDNSVELSKVEERLSKLKAVEIFEKELLRDKKPGTFDTLKSIHYHLFSEIYNFAGKVRNENISKGNFRFAPVIYLDDAIKNIESMPQSTFEEIVEKYVEMNIAHPFREGNGRSMRIWLDHMLKEEINMVVDWSHVSKDDYLLAMERSPIKDLEIKYLLKKALTSEINDREIYMKGIDMSYAYEGYETFKTNELNK